MVEGTKTQYYTDVKMPIFAGMEFGTTRYKLQKVGFEIIRQYFDNDVKDYQVGRERIKRVIK
jgi:hypothetical protein